MDFLTLSSDIFGLDIGDLSLKIAFLKKKGKKIQLKAYGEKKVPIGLFSRGEIKKQEEVIKIIRQFVKELKIRTPYVVSVLPETKTFIKTIEIQSLVKENILESIKKEIQLYIPFKIEEIYFDWKIISERVNKTKILVGVSPKHIVDSYLFVLKNAGLKPVSLEIESIAILEALLDKKEKFLKPLGIIDLGATRSSLIIVDEGIVQLTISLPLAGAVLTQSIADELKISFDQAQKMKIDFCKGEKNEVVEKKVNLFFENLTQSLINHLKFYEESSKRKIEKIIVCGGGANLPGLIPYFEKNLNIETIKGNPWVNILEKPPIPEDKSLIYTTALGLALRALQEKI